MGRNQGRDPNADAPASDETEIPFETAIERLEQVVDRLEEGDLALEEALSAFEEGVALSKRCATQLDAAERRIEVLTQEGGKWLTRPLDEADEFGAEEGEEG
jgi:exodeoxyribonuclease VII small subunit